MQYVSAIVSEYEFVINKPDEIVKYKLELDKALKSAAATRKEHKFEIDKLLREKEEMLKNYDSLKNNDIAKLEHTFKQGLEKMKRGGNE